MRTQQRLYFGPQSGVGGTRNFQVNLALTARQSDGLVQNFADLLPALGIHVAVLRAISRNNQARAVIQSRFTVEAEIPRTSAVSSIDSPPKNFSSTTWLCCESMLARRFKASSKATMSTSIGCGCSSASSRANL